MAQFNVNIFGTTHLNQVEYNNTDGYFLFNLHMLQVSYSGIVLSSFDMFLEYYAFPFNPLGSDLRYPVQPPRCNAEIGTTVEASTGTTTSTGQRLGARKSSSKPQIVHITGTTPVSAVTLYDCGNSFSIINPNGNPCVPPTLTSPCPSPEDIRIFSMSHYVKLKPAPTVQRFVIDNITPTTGKPPDTTTTTTIVCNTPPIIGGNFAFDPDWTDMRSNTFVGGLYILDNVTYKLPVKITIIANGCVYQKIVNVNIYPNYIQNPFLGGSGDCSFNPRYFPVGGTGRDTYTLS